MPYFISPVGNEQQFDANGAPLVGGKIYTYLAGSTTPAATYTDNTGSTPQANPIILNSLGVSSSPIWMLGGATLKFVIKTAADVTLRTVDNVSGINDVAGQAVNEWVASGLTATYISGTSFSFAGDQTPTFQVNRRVLTTNTAGSRYGTIQTSVFSAGVTTITLLMDSGTLDSGLSAVFYGIISVTNTSLPPNSSAIVAAIDSRLLAPGPIGSTTPNAGAFTTLSASTSVTSPIVTAKPSSNGDGIFNLSSAGTGAYAYLRLQNNGVTRWQLTKTNSAESGSNVGSDFQLQAFTDAGAFLVNALSVSRANGQMAAGITPAIGDNSLNLATTAYADRAALKGASWQSFFGSRVKTTVYTNSTGRPIAVTIRATGASTGARFRLVSNTGVVAGMSSEARNGGLACMLNSVVIPDGATYTMEDDIGTCTIVDWTELRT